MIQIINNSPIIRSNIEKIGAPELWKQDNKGQDIVVAVIDSGCDVEHEKFRSTIIDQYNFTDKSRPFDVHDYLYHGTHVAGVIAGSNKNIVTSIAPQAKLLILKVFHKSLIVSFENIVRAVDYARTWSGAGGERVQIINLSLGSKTKNTSLEKALNEAKDRGILVVSSAGNDGDGDLNTEELSYPGYYSEVLQVGALDDDGKVASFSNTNDQINFLAPGINILSSIPNNNYKSFSGTSMAAPHVTGLLALLLKIFNSNQLINKIYELNKQFNPRTIHPDLFLNS